MTTTTPGATINPGATGQDLSGSYDGAARASAGGNGQAATGSSATVDRIASGAHQAVDRIASAASSAANHLNVSGEDLLAAKDRWTQTCSTYVKDHPLTSLGIAVAAGFVLSRLVR